MDIRSTLAAQGYAAGRPATAADPASGGGLAGKFSSLVKDFATTVDQGDAMARAAMTGRADSQTLVTALAQSQLAIETAVAVRDKVVEAYQEILRMPV
jgi:flagellar hook-basal body complex protein FliE